MDVTLVLTHRCNLACSYCYAGEHIKRDMSPDVRERGVDLLFCDGAGVGQLGFFGGEPFIAFDQMRLAVAQARARADALGAQLLLQCTTNGALIGAEQADFIEASQMKVTVSIDGVREAHDTHRRRAGGRSSFDDVYRGLRLLIDRGLDPDVLMVVTPETVPFLARSVSWLWDEGVTRVRCNIDLTREWDQADQYGLRGELETLGWELMARRARGDRRISFEPFEAAMRAEAARFSRPAEAPGCGTRSPGSRNQVVVATGGDLYPCAPMVGEDRDGGPEAAVRIGHLDHGAAAIVESVTGDGAGCGNGGACECAAFLETGDRKTGGAIGLWFAAVTSEVGAALAAGERRDFERSRSAVVSRRPVLLTLAAAAGRLAIGGTMFLRGGLSDLIQPKGGCDVDEEPATAGKLSPPPQPPGGLAPPPQEPQPQQIEVDGDMGEPPPPPPPPKDRLVPRGRLRRPPEPPPKPEPEPKAVKTLGELR